MHLHNLTDTEFLVWMQRTHDPMLVARMQKYAVGQSDLAYSRACADCKADMIDKIQQLEGEPDLSYDVVCDMLSNFRDEEGVW